MAPTWRPTLRRGGKVIGAASLTCALVLSGCTEDPDPTEEPDPHSQAVTGPPAAEVTVLDHTDPAEFAEAISQELFQRAPTVVLASVDDPDSWSPAAEDAIQSGAPLLLVPTDSEEPGSGPDEELSRLQTSTVLTHGGGVAEWALARDNVEVVDRAGDTPVDLPGTPPAAPLDTLTVLTTGAPELTAATATAQAAGARILETTLSDPRADPDVIEALAEAPPSHTLALGADFGPPELLRQRLEVAATGEQLPGGGQVMFPYRRIVALYGHPGDSGLGVLGEQSRDRAIERAREVAGEYAEVADEPVVPALEIITTIASASAGPEGDYSRRTPVAELREWVDAAAEAGVYVVLDLQPGHTDFLTQAKEYEELLLEPHVGLALDPEWRLAPGQRHMVNIGSVSATEVNRVSQWLADLVAEHALPQKVLIVHQFQLRMISDRDDIDTSHDQLAVLIHADGFGTPQQKYDTWDALHADPLPGAWWGWKNFYDEDRPTLSPKETVAVEPSPLFISYQ